MSVIVLFFTNLFSNVNPVVLSVCLVFLSVVLYFFFAKTGSPEEVFEGRHWSLELLLRENKVYSREEISKHNDETDCWVTIDNWVFDLTRFLPRHPGGMGVLIKRAGQDCTVGFHGFQHPENAYTNLRDYIIGRLDTKERVRWISNDEIKKNNLHSFIFSVYTCPVKNEDDAKKYADKFVGYKQYSIPIETVHTHNQEWDCWIIIHDNIYDVTYWALEHPGGNIIKSKPGQDVSDLFDKFHSGNEEIKKKMQEFYVGPLLKQ